MWNNNRHCERSIPDHDHFVDAGSLLKFESLFRFIVKCWKVLLEWVELIESQCIMQEKNRTNSLEVMTLKRKERRDNSETCKRKNIYDLAVSATSKLNSRSIAYLKHLSCQLLSKSGNLRLWLFTDRMRQLSGFKSRHHGNIKRWKRSVEKSERYI